MVRRVEDDEEYAECSCYSNGDILSCRVHDMVVAINEYNLYVATLRRGSFEK